MAGPCEHGKELSGSIRSGKYLDYMSDYELLKMDSAPWSYNLFANDQPVQVG
jgi:hypothetical protein